MDSIEKKVTDWSKEFGLLVEEKPNFKPNPQDIAFGLNHVKEEMEETARAFHLVKDGDGNYIPSEKTGDLDESDFVEAIDGVGDLVWVGIRLSNMLGVSITQLIDIIYDANMSKICDTLAEAERTKNHYEMTEGPMLIKKTPSGKYVVRANKPGQKVRKNINWKPPKFHKILENL